MNAKEAAQWHRIESDLAAGRAKRATIHKHVHTTPTAAHDLAARVLDALAVPGVADVLDGIATGRIRMIDSDGLHYGTTKDARTALRTLADAAKGAHDEQRRGGR